MGQYEHYQEVVHRCLNNYLTTTGMSYEAFARKADIHVRTIYRLRKNPVNVSLQTLCLVAEGMDMDLTDLLNSDKR